MDFRDKSIITQVAFKGAIDIAKEQELDLTDPDGHAQFETVFAYLTNSLFLMIGDGDEHAAQVIQAAFPGAVVQQQTGTEPFISGTAAVPPPPPAQSTQWQPIQVKGTQYGPLPEWLFEQAAQAGVREVYDNRDRIAGTRRPWFRATTGGDRATGFWPPRGQ